MPALIAVLWNVLIALIGTIVGKALVSLGIGYVTYTGVDLAITWARDAFLSGLTGVPAAAVGLASVMKVGVCVSMLLSAVTARMTLAGLTAAGSVRKMTVK